jgi:hypothetical protein
MFDNHLFRLLSLVWAQPYLLLEQIRNHAHDRFLILSLMFR